MGNLLKKKWLWIIGGVVVLIISFAITGVGKEKSMPEKEKPEIIIQQEQQKEVKKEASKARLANCLQEAGAWFVQAKQTTIKILEEEKRTYNPYQEFIDQYASGLDEIMISLSEELEDYKAECFKRYPQQ